MKRAMPRFAAGQFYCQLLMSERIADVVCSETMQSPDLEVPVHQHDWPFLELALKGSWTETVGREQRQFETDTLVYHPPGECHANRMSARGGRAFHVELSPRWVVRLTEARLDPESPVVFREAATGEGLRRLRAELHRRDEWSALAVEGLLHETFAAMGRRRAGNQRSRAPHWLNRAVEELREEDTGPRSLSDLAASVGVSPSVFSRTFRQHLDCTPSDYLRRVRVERARALILGSDESLASIGLRVGFADQSHFTRVFRRVTGQTPNEVRHRYRGNSDGAARFRRR
jgi:AraC family transcriptional regulator